MAITLPRASPASGGTGAGRRGVRLPGPSDVPRVAPTRDSGLNVPDFGAEARALGELGEAIEGVALRAQAAEEADRRKAEAARDRLELSSADADLLTEKTRIEVEFETDVEFDTQLPRYGETLAAFANTTAEGITDPDVKQLFLDNARKDIVTGAASLAGRVRARRGDVAVAALNRRLTTLREQGLLAKDAAGRRLAVETAINSIRAVEARGFIDAATAQRSEETFQVDFAKARVLLQPPEERVKLLTGRPEGVVAAIPADDRARLREQAEAEIRAKQLHRVKLIKQGFGLAVAADEGAIPPLADFNAADPFSYRARAVAAQDASEHLGVTVPPLLPPEVKALAAAISVAPADGVVGLLQAAHDGLGRDGALALADRFKEAEIGVAMALVPDNPELSREIVLGGRLLRANPDVKPSRTDRLASVADIVGNVFTAETAAALDPFLDAATALYAARQVPTGDLDFDDDTFEDALRDVMGGPFEFNDRMILPPVPGMEEDVFDDLMDSLTQADLTEFGNGTPMFEDGKPFTVSVRAAPAPAAMLAATVPETTAGARDMFDAGAQLVTSGFGKYLVFLDGLGYVQTETGEPYEINLRAFAEKALTP